MKIVIAPDSFKESLSAAGVAEAIAEGVRLAVPQAQIVCVPMADGGEGTVDAVLAATGGDRKTLRVRGALGAEQDAHWGWLDGKTAIIEMASAAGLEQIAPRDRRPLEASSYGVGQLMRAALDAGATRIILGLGGSSTTDGGAGMLQALGLKLRDAQGKELAPGGAALASLDSIDASGLDPRLANTRIDVASDVNNPLCGPKGAAHIFGPQKGATPEQVKQLDQALSRFADVSAKHLSRDVREQPGAGAAGGLGFGAYAYLSASFRPGVEIVAELGGLAAHMEGAALAFTGEGRMDAQTLHGKTPAGVAGIARQAGVPVVALVGSLGPGYQELYGAGISAAFSLAHGPMTLEDACRDTAALLSARARDAMQLWLAGRKHVL